MTNPFLLYVGSLKSALQGDLPRAESLYLKAEALKSQEGLSFSESVHPDFPYLEQALGTLLRSYDFARCVRPDGSAYGTRGKCRKGTESQKEPKNTKQERPESMVKRSTYSWGSIIKLSKKGQPGAVLHPEHQEELASLKDGEKGKFKDETGMVWNSQRRGNIIHLEGGDKPYGDKPYKHSFDRSELM